MTRVVAVGAQHVRLRSSLMNGVAVYRYGDKAIAPEMLKMVRIAQKHNAAAKFPGSGGAVVGMCRGDHGRKNLAQLRKEYEEEVRLLRLVLLLPLRLDHS